MNEMDNPPWRDPQSPWYIMPSNHRLLPGDPRYKWVKRHIDFDSRVLDIGCNCGQLAVNLTTELGCHGIGLDVVWEFIEHCRRENLRHWYFHQQTFSPGTS